MCQNMTNTTCSVEALQAVAYVPLFILGLLLNATALWAFLRGRRAWRDTDVYMLNLTAADLALIAFLPFRIVDAFRCLDRSYLCTVLISVHYVNMYASILTSTALSVHRFLLVKLPLSNRNPGGNRKQAAAVCVMIWLLVIALCAAYSSDNHPDKLWTCFERSKHIPIQKGFLALLVTLGFLVPLVVVVCCSSQIIVALTGKDDCREKKSVVGIVKANMIVFIFCYTPIHASLLLNYSGVAVMTCQTAHRLLLVSEWIASTNCCLDSISYYFLFKSLRHRPGEETKT